MARANKEIIALIVAAAVAKNIEPAPVTEGLKNDELEALLADINKPAEGSAPPPPAPPEADPTETAKPPKAKKRPPFYVIDGKAVTTKRGVRADGDEVVESDFNEGKTTIADLIERGYVAKGDKK